MRRSRLCSSICPANAVIVLRSITEVASVNFMRELVDVIFFELDLH
jgi:hypothetical protein